MINGWPESVVNDQGNVFSGGNQGLKFHDIQVQVFVVKIIGDACSDQFTECFHIDHITGDRVCLARDPYDQIVIVSMKVGMVALAKNAMVFCLTEVRVVQSVGCIEMFLSGYCSLHDP